LIIRERLYGGPIKNLTSSKPRRRGTAVQKDATTSKAGTLLCVDDDSGTLKLRRVLLESQGYFVITTESGFEALELLGSNLAVDLVMLDYNMPGMKGDELAQRLRESHPNLPLLSVSGIAELPDLLLKNVDASLQKGEEPQVLLDTIGDLLRHGSLASTPRSKTILCVEDEQLQLKLRRLLFESVGYTVFEALSGAAALEVFRSHNVDAVVMDYSIAGTDGVSLATQLKAFRPGTPIIVLSGSPPESSLEGVVDCWYRKFDIEPEELLAKVHSLLAVDRLGKGPAHAS
jgi:CheY-like chemotaxis protein